MNDRFRQVSTAVNLLKVALYTDQIIRKLMRRSRNPVQTFTLHPEITRLSAVMYLPDLFLN